MPGSIFITKEKTIDIYRISFDAITNFSRPFFENEDSENAVYFHIDVGMDSVFAYELSNKDFNEMYQAFVKGLDYYKKFCKSLVFNEDITHTIDTWQKLLYELQKDSRYIPKS